MNSAVDYPRLPLHELEGGPDLVVLCPTARLAGEVRRRHGELQMARGARRWAPLNGATPAQWLDHLVSAALLRGDIPVEAMPTAFLTHAQELALWQSLIGDDAALDAGLFDKEGLATAAMEADALITTWRLDLVGEPETTEFAALRRWRRAFAERCRSKSWFSGARTTEWRIACIERGIDGLPARVCVAGFVHLDPLVRRLLLALEQRGVEVFTVDLGEHESFNVSGKGRPPRRLAYVEAQEECRAAAQWAASRLSACPTARLRLVCLDAAVIPVLERALGRELAPAPGGALPGDEEPAYVNVRGKALNESSVISVALRLLQLLLSPQQVDHAQFGILLRQPGWGADVSETDERARFEVILREQLPPETTLAAIAGVLRAVRLSDGARFGLETLERLLAMMTGMSGRWPKRQAPRAWGETFRQVLLDLGWPGERTLSLEQRTAIESFSGELEALALLGKVLGNISASEALSLLRRACRSRRFLLARERPAGVEIATMADALGTSCDGLWVMGALDGVWPAPVRANPLLPAQLQRRADIPEARGDLLFAQAETLRESLANAAPEVVFSYAQRSGDTPLHPSAVIETLPVGDSEEAMLAVPRPLYRAEMESVQDSVAPPVPAGSTLSGGTGLLQAQSICPAWAFFRYRVHCAVLPRLTFGLDPRTHGSMVHAALEAFWVGKNQADLLALSPGELGLEIARVVERGMAKVRTRERSRYGNRPIPARLLVLEAELLSRLLASWLEQESKRAEFRVLACETAQVVSSAGINIRLVIDRIDELPDGRRVVLDYKTGAKLSAGSWSQARIREPQLPAYASVVLPDQPLAAVALAQLHPKESRFIGVAAEDDVLPGVAVLGGSGRAAQAYSFAGVSDLAGLRQRWADAIAQLTGEIAAGEASVRVADEKDLANCDVLPLLRLAERRLQWRGEP